MTQTKTSVPRTVLITGTSGLIGSEAVTYFHGLKVRVHGIDNNMRADFFGPAGDTSWNLARLKEEFNYRSDSTAWSAPFCPKIHYGQFI